VPATRKSAEHWLESLATAVIVLDQRDHISGLNSAAEGLLGISRHRALGQGLTGLAPGSEGLAELVSRARLERQSFGDMLRVAAPQRDGTELELAVRISPSGDDTDESVLIEMFDITRRHHLDRENALVAQRGVSRRMLRQLAHEIRNPLGGLRGAAQLLERELDDPSLHEFTRVIINEADRLESLVAGLLGPGGRPDKQLVNIHEVLEHVAKLVSSESPGLILERDYDPSVPDMLLDRDQMTQAFLNLLRNAVQAIDSDGIVLLRTRVATHQVLNGRLHKLLALVDIEDSGHGVPDDIADTLFYPLVTGRKDGTGIGLPLAQDLVNRHDGLIEFRSRPGQTVFTVSLPMLENPAASL